jgi:hypothetical protein
MGYTVMYPIDGAHLSINYLGQLAAATLDIKASLDKIIENKILLYVRLYVRSVLYRTLNLLLLEMHRILERTNYEYWFEKFPCEGV